MLLPLTITAAVMPECLWSSQGWGLICPSSVCAAPRRINTLVGMHSLHEMQLCTRQLVVRGKCAFAISQFHFPGQCCSV